MTADELKKTLEMHRKWLFGESDGVRTNLTMADLTGASLRGADLREANLREANLREANLTMANLTGASLRGADLKGASLRGADLKGANLTMANLTMADLREANLTGASLRGADLKGADLKGANLPHHSVCPEEGAFIAWKKVCGGVLLKLQIPEDARRVSSLIGRKCRADKLLVLSAEDYDGNPVAKTEFRSTYDGMFTYRVGEVATVTEFCDDIRQECRPGLHFFITRREALIY